MTTATKSKPTLAGGPHANAKPKQCHCNPHPHKPCAHTHLSASKKAAAKKKSAATHASNLARAEKILAAHPPTKEQIAKAIVIQKNNREQAKIKNAAKAAKLTTSQRAAAHKKHVISANKAAATRAKHKALKVKGAPSGPPIKKLPSIFLHNAMKTVSAQNKALAASKVKHHRKANPHKPPAKKTAKAKC